MSTWYCEAILEEITEWINKPNGNDVPQIFFLSGVAGSGKSAIAHTIASRFRELQWLGSSFCFDRSNHVGQHPDNLFSTVTLDIADLDPLWLENFPMYGTGHFDLQLPLENSLPISS
jgi:hypothetical protein